MFVNPSGKPDPLNKPPTIPDRPKPPPKLTSSLAHISRPVQVSIQGSKEESRGAKKEEKWEVGEERREGRGTWIRLEVELCAAPVTTLGWRSGGNEGQLSLPFDRESGWGGGTNRCTGSWCPTSAMGWSGGQLLWVPDRATRGRTNETEPLGNGPGDVGNRGQRSGSVSSGAGGERD